MNRQLLSICITIILLTVAYTSNAQCTGGTDGGAITPTSTYQTTTFANAGIYKTFTAVMNSTYNFTFCSNGGSASYDTELTILDNTGTLVPGAFNDQFCGDQSNLTWKAPSNGTFRVLVTQWPCTVSGGSSATLAYVSVPPPVNDACPGAILVGIPSTTAGSTTSANTDTAIPCGTAADDSNGGVWYAVTGNGQKITASLCNGTNFDTQIRVFSGSCGGLVCVAGNDDNGPACATSRSSVTWCSTTGTVYRILVHGWSASGDFSLEISGQNVPQPIITPSAPTSCAGVSTPLTASGLNNYLWSPATEIAPTNLASVVATPTTTRTYTVSGIETTTLCQSSGSVSVTITPAPPITVQPQGRNICNNENVTFTVTATGTGLTYQWQESINGGGVYSILSNGGIYSGVTTNALTLTGATTANNAYKYKCIVTGTCSTTSAVADLFVQTVPILTGQPSNATVCEGGNTSFTVTTSTGTGGFQWQIDNGSGYTNYGSFSGSGTLNLSGVPASMNGNKFRCIVGLCTPSVISGEATLTVNVGATITTQPTTTGICVTGNTSFSVVATGTGLTYQWQRGGVNLSNAGVYSGATTSTLSLTGATATDAGSYQCLITGTNTCITASGYAVLYFYTSPVITTQPNNAVKCVGATATYSVAITPQAGVSYQWQEKIPSGSFTNLSNGGVYSGVTGTTLTLTGVTASMDGNKYQCVVGTCATPVISFEADLVVDSPPVVTVHPQPSTICVGMNTTFTADGTGLGLTFQWQSQPGGTGSYSNIVDGGIYSGATTGTLTLTNVTLTETLTRYRCVLTASGVCASVNTGNVPITVRPIPTINNQPIDRVMCEGSTINLSSSANNAFNTYQWQIDTGSGFVDMASSTEYPNVNLQSLSFIALPSQNGNKYRLNVGGCTPSVFSNEVTVTVYTTPTITTQPLPATICEGGDATFEVTATGTSLVYQWRRGGSAIADGSLHSGVTTSKLTITGFTGSSVEYTCTITGGTGCAPVTTTPALLTVDQIQITNHPTAVAAFCDGGNATFSVTATGQGLAYQWWELNNGTFTELVNGGVYSGVTTSTLTLSNVPFNMNSRAYRCVVSGCGIDQVSNFSSGLAVFPIPAKPIITSSLSNPEAPVLTTSGGSTYQWFKNGTAISGATSSNYTVSGEGSYTVHLVLNGCMSPLSDPFVIIITGDLGDISSSAVQVYPNPVVDRLTISLSNFNVSKPVAVSITDMLGRSMTQSSIIGKTSIDIDVSPYKYGQYMVRLQQDQRAVVTQFIKSNR